MKLPSFQFYPGDYLKDSNLARCSFSAQGAWMRLLCIMFGCEQSGVLRTNGTPWTKKEAADSIGAPLKLVQELIDKGVCKVSRRTGALYCLRLIKDMRLRKAKAVSGAKGGKQKASKVVANLKQTAKQTPPSSSSTSTSVVPPTPGGGESVAAASPENPVVVGPTHPAWEAVNRWAVQATGYGLPHGRNHERAIERLIAELNGESTVIFGGTSVRRGELIPQAVEAIMREGKVKPPRAAQAFVAYAVACIRNALDEWSVKGTPQPDASQQSAAQKTAKVPNYAIENEAGQRALAALRQGAL